MTTTHDTATATVRRAPSIERHPAALLHIDRRVQRELNPRRVDEMANNLKFDALGVSTVSRRPDGTLVQLDGQHRRAAVIQAGHGGYEMTCNVYTGLSFAEEAALFRDLNNTRKPSIFDDYDKAVKGEDPEALAIDAIVRGHELHVAEKTMAHGSVRAVGALRKAYRASEPAGHSLDLALGSIVEAWGREAGSFDGNVIVGLSMIFAANPETDQHHLIRALAKYPGGSDRLIGDARQMRDLQGGHLPKNVARRVIVIYNGRRRTGQIPPI
jgi:hypothetical protein